MRQVEDVFTCANCELTHAGSAVFDEGEYARSFPEHSVEEAVPLCGDCYAFLKVWPGKVEGAAELARFVHESNRIEGIHRPPLMREIVAHWKFLQEPVSVTSLVMLVRWLQPDAYLRVAEGCNVVVGKHVPPAGGPGIYRALEALLEAPYGRAQRHHAYETLHPFTDGNGRSGRAMWLHDKGGPQNAPLGFLHHWYYESLEFLRPAKDYEQR